jgi:hypothetical protein
MKLLFLLLVLLTSPFALLNAQTVRSDYVSNLWISHSNTNIPYGMVAQIFNPTNSTYNVFVDKIIVSDNPATAGQIVEFGVSLDNAQNTNCTGGDASQNINLGQPNSPAAIFHGLPCGNYMQTSFGAFERWYTQPGTPFYEENIIPMSPPGFGVGLWTAVWDGTALVGWTGGLAITIKWHQCSNLGLC